MTHLNFVNIFAKDIERLSRFYIDLFGFSENEEMRYPIFREVRAGSISLGFNAEEAYSLLSLEDFKNAQGVGFLLNFECDSEDAVDSLVSRLVELGGTIVKDPYKTYYGWYQAVALDPEGNCFRLNHMGRA